MNEKLIQLKDKIIDFWKARTTVQKGLMIGSVVSLIALLIIVTTLASKTNLVPLYKNLALQETGQIQETLNARGVQYEVADNGTTIMVPEPMVDTLMVELAAEGIPDSGNIDYSFFGQNSGFGMTNEEFKVLKVEAMQTELANLIKEIDGVDDAKVMLSIPEPSVWMNQAESPSSASIVLKQRLGARFNQTQINALYHLVSRSVPNLPIDNIVIMNQMFEPFEVKNSNNNNLNVGEQFASQFGIEQEIENDIKSQVEQMLGMMLGRDKIVVSVTADLDFTKENRTVTEYQPVDTENMEGITRSVERITETFSGNGTVPGGVAGTGEEDVPNYAEVNGTNGDYERIEERINREVNKINREITESPYEIRNLGIQVAVDPTIGTETTEEGAEQPVLLDAQQQEELRTNIQEMLSTIIRTSMSAEQNPNLNENISITMQPFNGRVVFDSPNNGVPNWIYIAAGALLLIIAIVVVLLVRRNKKVEAEEPEEVVEEADSEIPDIEKGMETEAGLRRKQLEKMAKEKPDEFAKLLRTWLAED